MVSNQIVIQVKANLVWQVARDPETGIHVGVCPPLNLNAVGDTWGEFMQCANEATGLLLFDLFEDGELDAFLKANGWQLMNKIPEKGRPFRFDVPFDISQQPIERVVATA